MENKEEEPIQEEQVQSSLANYQLIKQLVEESQEKAPRNSIQIGDFSISTSDLTSEQLANLVVQLIQHPSIKDYLLEIKTARVRTRGTHFG